MAEVGKYFFVADGSFLVADDVMVYGSGSGTETLQITGTPSVEMDANVDVVELSGALADYTYAFSSEGFVLKSGTTTVLTVASLNADVTLKFSDGSTTLAQTGVGAATLGGSTLSETDQSFATTDLTSFDSTDGSSIGGDDTTGGGDDTTGGGDDTTGGGDGTDDTTAPTISSVSIPNSAMKVGDTVTVSITAGEAGLSLVSGKVNGVSVTGFTDNGGGSYTAYYTVADGGTDVTAAQSIPVSFVLKDAADNSSIEYAKPISQSADSIDANLPALSYTSPKSGASSVNASPTLLLVFDEEVSLGSAGFIAINPAGDDATGVADPVVYDLSKKPAQVTAEGFNVVIDLSAVTLVSGETYALHVEKGAVVDSAGNAFAGLPNGSSSVTFDIA